ncbi:putative 3-phosphoinositide dependent protein kinase-1 [Xylariales sp. AK1849]|nr:putative 3-phosphoinositide dependent protein kinase-1 [Xylariales sp. AK1849]
MNNDLSLSRALGGLRIANPDDGIPSPPREVSAHPGGPHAPEASVTEYDSHASRSRSQTAESSRPSPLGSQADPQSQLNAYPQNGALPYANPSPSSHAESSLYTTAERDQAAKSYNLLRTEPSRTSLFNTPNRTDSRSTPTYSVDPSNVPSREASHRDRTYNLNRQLPMSNSSEEWKDKGAAVSMRKEVDSNGKTVMKSVKKGVRDFAFGRILGEGSYSTVYLATDRQTLKEYAVKVLEKRHIIKEKKIKYVNIEKDTLNRLTEHPGIVRLYYTFQDESSLYYVLDLCTGGELLGVLKKTGTFDEECTRFFGAQILDAIEYMHSRGVIHRDLKPENVLLDDQLHVKITDFGTARLLTDPRLPKTQQAPKLEDPSGQTKSTDETRAESFVGTAEYVSPELLKDRNACKASDLWAFGCMIYQMLAGRPPFKGNTEYLTFEKIMSLDYEFPPGFSPVARDLVERLLVPDPSRRLTIEHIKNHQFFDGQAFGKGLWRTKAPRLRPYTGGEHGEGHRKFRAFFGGSTTKKRQRLVMVTSSGRIVLAPAGGEEKKAKQEVSLLAPDSAWRTQIDVKGQTVWCVDSYGVHYTFEEPKAANSLDSSRPTAEDWLQSLEQAKDMAMSQNITGSYSNENGFGDMSSSMSSPASTFGGNSGYTEGFGISDRSHRNHLSKSQITSLPRTNASWHPTSAPAFCLTRGYSPSFEFDRLRTRALRITHSSLAKMQPGYRQPYPQQQVPQRTPHTASQRRGGIGPMMSSGPHHQVPLTQAQIAQQQQQQAMQVEMAKRRSRKPTDKNLPDNIDGALIGDQATKYRDLRDFERRLDATMTRKRLDIVDSVNRSAKRWKTLRIWITNTAEDQVWQSSGLNVDSFDFSSNLEPTYRVKIEGRLLDDDNDPDKVDETEAPDTKTDPDKMDEDGDSKPKAAKAPRYRFSHFFRALNVDFPANRKGVDQSVEWKKPERAGTSSNLPAAADFDELTFKRSGDENLNVTINLTRHEDPERYALSPEMQDVVDKPEATRQEAVMAIWDYIKFTGLQEDEDKRTFRCDELLKKALGGLEQGNIPMLHSYITPSLKPLPAVKLPYTIRVDEEFQKDPQPTVYDVRVAVDDPLRDKMTAFLSNAGYASMLKEAAGLDDQLATIIQALHISKAKHAFLTSLSEDPATFVNNWLSSQKRDLDVVMGEAMRGGGEDASGDEWRKGGRDSVWNTVNAKESVSVLLAKHPQHVQR